MKSCTNALLRLLIDFFRRSGLLDASLVEHDHAVGDLQRLLLIVGHEHGGDMDLVVQLAQPAPQLLADLGVERAERLVEQQDARLDGERARQRDALALAAGQLRRIAVAERAELDQIEQASRRARGSRPRAGASRRGRARSPNATFSNTVMCRNSA